MPPKDPVARAAYNAEYRKRPGTLAAEQCRRSARRDATNAQAAEYRAANRERLRERSRAWCLANPEKTAEMKARTYAERKVRHPGLDAAQSAATNANIRAVMRGVQGRLTVDDLLTLWAIQPRCVDCGVECRGVDHVIEMADGGPNTPDNLANRCRSCNGRKALSARAARRRRAA